MQSLLKLSLALTLLNVAYADLDVDVYDIPATCQAVCRPTLELSRICDVDRRLVGSEFVEFENERGCYCTNQSYDVGRLTALCQSCVQQNAIEWRQSREINDLMAICAFAPVQFTAADATAADGIIVQAAAPVGQDPDFGPGGPGKGKGARGGRWRGVLPVVPRDNHASVDSVIPRDNHASVDSVIPRDNHASVDSVIPRDNHASVDSVIPRDNHASVDGVIPRDNHASVDSVIPRDNHASVDSADD